MDFLAWKKHTVFFFPAQFISNGHRHQQAHVAIRQPALVLIDAEPIRVQTHDTPVAVSPGRSIRGLHGSPNVPLAARAMREAASMEIPQDTIHEGACMELADFASHKWRIMTCVRVLVPSTRPQRVPTMPQPVQCCARDGWL